mgnify:CR=1 FL=1
MFLRHDYRSRPPEQVRVVVFGATGYLGRFVVKELVERGYQVIAFARERSGIFTCTRPLEERCARVLLHYSIEVRVPRLLPCLLLGNGLEQPHLLLPLYLKT